MLEPKGLHEGEHHSGGEQPVLSLPVLDRGHLCGVVSLGLASGKQSVLSGKETFLRDILAIVCGLIHSLKIAEWAKHRVENLAVLHELGLRFNSSAPPGELIDRILTSCHRHAGACCTVLRLLPGNSLAAGVYRRCSNRQRRNLPTVLRIESGTWSRVLDSRMPVLAIDLVSEVDFPPSYVCVPLMTGTNCLGTMTFFGKRNGSGAFENFDEDDREFMESMANLVATSLQGATSFQQISRLSADNDKKLRELTLLNRVSSTMLSTTSLNRLIHLILVALTSGTTPFFDRAMLFLINKRSGVMQGMLGVSRETVAGLVGPLDSESWEQGRIWELPDETIALHRGSDLSRQVMDTRMLIDRSKNITSRAVLDKKLIHVSDISREKRLDRDFVDRFGISAFASVPLIAKDQVVGVVIVDNPTSGRVMSQADLRFLQLFANQAGMAIENSMLYNRIEDTNRELQEAQQRLIQGEKLAAIGEMAASIAHELKTPLISIGGVARRLERKVEPGSEVHGYVDIIVREVHRLEKMLTDILSFSRKSTLCYDWSDMREIVDEALLVVEAPLASRRIEVAKHFLLRRIRVLGDAQQLKQIFINLFLNAHDAMEDGGKLSVDIATARLNGRKAVSVKVADSGGGIPTELLNNIFNPFFTTKESGTGLGLAITQKIVASHGGRITVKNRPGIGAEFTVTIPLQQ